MALRFWKSFKVAAGVRINRKRSLKSHASAITARASFSITRKSGNTSSSPLRLIPVILAVHGIAA